MNAVSSPFDRQLQVLADDERRARSARARMQNSDRKMVAALSGTFRGTLVELHETAAPVTVLTRTGASIRGTVLTVGKDVVVIRTNKSGSDACIRIEAVEALLEAGKGHDRRITESGNGPSFAELLDTYSESADRIAVTTASGNQVMGTVVRVGEDQVVLQLDGNGDAMTLRLPAIDQVVRSR